MAKAKLKYYHDKILALHNATAALLKEMAEENNRPSPGNRGHRRTTREDALLKYRLKYEKKESKK